MPQRRFGLDVNGYRDDVPRAGSAPTRASVSQVLESRQRFERVFDRRRRLGINACAMGSQFLRRRTGVPAPETESADLLHSILPLIAVFPIGHDQSNYGTNLYLSI